MKVLLLFFLISSLVLAEKVSYRGYTVLRMQINTTNYEDIISLTNKYNLDIWAQNKVKNWMDIMIPPNPEISEIIKQHDHVVHIEDVEEHIQSIEGQNTQNVTRKRQVFFDYYPNWEEIQEWLVVQHDLHPQTTELIVVGQTYQGRNIRGIKIFNNNKSPAEKKVIMISGGIHAREWITVTTTLYTIQQLLQNPSDIVDDFDFYIVPVYNVDGYVHTRTERLWRKNRQPVSGSSCLGTDLNRNFDFQWGRGGSSPNPCTETYMGTAPESAPEVYDISEYIKTTIGERLAFFLDVHSYGGMWMSPYGYTYQLPVDYNEMYAVMEVARSSIRAINGNVYQIGSSANVIYIVSGGYKDWTYATVGVVPSFTVEIVGNSFIEPTTSILPLAREIWNGVISVSEFVRTKL